MDFDADPAPAPGLLPVVDADDSSRATPLGRSPPGNLLGHLQKHLNRGANFERQVAGEIDPPNRNVGRLRGLRRHIRTGQGLNGERNLQFVPGCKSPLFRIHFASPLTSEKLASWRQVKFLLGIAPKCSCCIDCIGPEASPLEFLVP